MRLRHRRRRRDHDARAVRAWARREEAFSRSAEIYDTTIGWRFVNPLMKEQYGVDSMPETGENVAEEFQVTRADQDAFALRSQQRAGRGRRPTAISPRRSCRSTIPQRKGDAGHGRAATSIRAPTPRSSSWPSCKTPFRNPGTVTAGNASGVNDGAAALIVASEAGGERARPDAARARARHGVGRRAAAHHGHRPGAGDAAS